MKERELGWGLSDAKVPDNAVTAWGARAIFKNGLVDVLSDRKDYWPDVPPFEFVEWLQGEAFSALDDWADKVWNSEDKLFSYDKGKRHLRANPKASHGYLYITAWMEE